MVQFMDPIPMNIFGIEGRRIAGMRAVGILTFGILFSLGGGRALASDIFENYELRSEVTVGTRLYVVESPYDNDNVTGFFDQYRYIEKKDQRLSYFFDFQDLFQHVDLGLMREDGTYLLRAEHFSRNAINSNTLFDFDWRGLDIDAEIWRIRSDSLLFFPSGTEEGWVPPPGEQPSTFALGSTYSPMVSAGDFFVRDDRIYVERLSAGGEIGFRPEDFGLDTAFLDQARMRARHETRTGYRQDSFLLDSRENISSLQSFRGNGRRIDQSLTSLGSSLVLSPPGALTGLIAFDFEHFEEEAPIVTLADLATPASGITPPNARPETLGREFFFVPDTNRFSLSLELARRGGGATFDFGAFASHLEQTGRRSNLQSLKGLPDNAVTTASAHADFFIPFGSVDLTGFVKYNHRNNDLNQAVFAQLEPFDRQESPYIKKRGELQASLEAGVSPYRGSRLGLGYALDRVDRDLVYPDPGSSGILPRVSLIGEKSLRHRVFLEGRGRFFRSLRASGELSYFRAPEVAYPTDLSEGIDFRARTHYTLPLSLLEFPISLTASGRVLDGENKEFELPCPAALACDSRKRKFERLEWGYDLGLTLMPGDSFVFYGTFSQAADRQDFQYMRTDFPRYFEGASFFIDSIPHYESDVKSLTLGGTANAFYGIDFGLSASFTWVDLSANGDSNVGSNVGKLINEANRVDSRIFSLDGEIDYRISPVFEFGIGYRYEEFVDDAQLGPLDFDSSVHRITLRVSIDFGALARPPAEAF